MLAAPATACSTTKATSRPRRGTTTTSVMKIPIYADNTYAVCDLSIGVLHAVAPSCPSTSLLLSHDSGGQWQGGLWVSEWVGA